MTSMLGIPIATSALLRPTSEVVIQIIPSSSSSSSSSLSSSSSMVHEEKKIKPLIFFIDVLDDETMLTIECVNGTSLTLKSADENKKTFISKSFIDKIETISTLASQEGWSRIVTFVKNQTQEGEVPIIVHWGLGLHYNGYFRTILSSGTTGLGLPKGTQFCDTCHYQVKKYGIDNLRSLIVHLLDQSNDSSTETVAFDNNTRASVNCIKKYTIHELSKSLSLMNHPVMPNVAFPTLINEVATSVLQALLMTNVLTSSFSESFYNHFKEYCSESVLLLNNEVIGYQLSTSIDKRFTLSYYQKVNSAEIKIIIDDSRKPPIQGYMLRYSPNAVDDGIASPLRSLSIKRGVPMQPRTQQQLSILSPQSRPKPQIPPSAKKE